VLHVAIIVNGDLPLILLLLKYGAEASFGLRNSQGHTPADLTKDSQLKQTLSGLQTSLTHPLSITFIDGLEVPGRLGITMCPGRKQKMWARDLQRDIQVLSKSSCNVLVSAITRKELSDMGISDLKVRAKQNKIESIQVSISNKWVPNSLDEFFHLTTTLVERMRSGKCVVVHCDSGKGRTSLVTAALLIHLGLTQEKATQLLRVVDDDLLRNPAHQVFLYKFRGAVLEHEEQEKIKEQKGFKKFKFDYSQTLSEEPDVVIGATIHDTTFSV